MAQREGHLSERERGRWLAEHDEPAGKFRIGEDGEDHVAEWTGVATLRAKSRGADARLTFEPGCPADARKKIEGGSAMLLLRHLRGEIALHGAAVAKDGRALVLLGRSGDGKSTLAHALVQDHGWELLADDAIAIDHATDGYRVIPTESLLWLAPTGARAKHAQPARAIALRPTLLTAAITLAFTEGGPPSLTRLSPMLSARAWVQSFVRFALRDKELLALEARRVADLSASVIVAELSRPRDLARSGEAAALLTSARLA